MEHIDKIKETITKELNRTKELRQYSIDQQLTLAKWHYESQIEALEEAIRIIDEVLR